MATTEISVCSQEFFESEHMTHYHPIVRRTYDWLEMHMPMGGWSVHKKFRYPLVIVFHDEADALLYKLTFI